MAIEMEDGRPPEWMIALENKQKRQHKLAHDVGAGAPCLNCNEQCAGLDLHFWRKICRNCKCQKEVHDVKEENFREQFEILFGDDLKGHDRVKKMSLNLKSKLGYVFAVKDASVKDPNPSGKTESDLLFDWIPSDVPINLASEYLQQLPLEKLPITGSAGAMFRRQQLQKQIPLHDFKINDCHDLTDEETVAFSEYIDNLKTHAVGKGQITKILLSPYTSADHRIQFYTNNLNPKPFKGYSECKPFVTEEEFPPPPPELLHSNVDLKPPSAFVSYKIPNIGYMVNPEPFNINVPYSTETFLYDKYKESSSPIEGITAQYSQKLTLSEKDSQNNNWYISNDKAKDHDKQTPTPSPLIRDLKSQPSAITESEGNITNKNPTYKKNPTSLNNRNVSPSRNVEGVYVKMVSPEGFIAVSSNVSGSPQLSDTLTASRNMYRNPKLNSNVTNPNDEPTFSNQQLFHPTLNSVQPIPQVQFKHELICHQCKQVSLPGQIVVVTERAGVEVIWHPQCFVCVICKELLVDLVYFFHHGNVYCGRHYAEVLKVPRCFACDELIFLKEYTVAENQTFHLKHFCCFECDIPLAGKQYIPKDGNPVCLPCYQAKYGKQCHYCEEIINAGESRVGWSNLSWHATDSCFKCIQCSKSLLEGKFVVKNNSPLCSKECVTAFQQYLTHL